MTIAAQELPPLQNAFASLGLTPEYGGPHSNGITHRALLGFEDGAYIELIANMQAGKVAPWWKDAIVGNGGPCAWAASAQNIQAESARLAAAGIPVSGPHAMHRQRPDGRRVEWELTYLGAGEPGATLPFLIEDHTPRDWRVRPKPGARERGLLGIAAVVLGVRDLAASIALFEQAYGWPASMQTGQDDLWLGAQLAAFSGTPVILAAPIDSGTGWLAERLATFGEMPGAYVLRTEDLPTATARFGLIQPSNWFGQPLAWFDPQRLNGIRLACMA